MILENWKRFVHQARAKTSSGSPQLLESPPSISSPHCYSDCTNTTMGVSFHGGIHIEIDPRQFLEAQKAIPSPGSQSRSNLLEDLHDELSSASLLGASGLNISTFGECVTVEIQKDTAKYDPSLHGYERFTSDLESWEESYTEIKEVVHNFLVERGYATVITEEKGRMRQHGIYRFGCLIEYDVSTGDNQRGLDDIVSDIRAIPTVTIVSIVLGNERISEKRYVAGLRIKYIPSYPGSLAQPEEAKAYILRMIKRIKNVRSISRVTLKTDRVE